MNEESENLDKSEKLPAPIAPVEEKVIMQKNLNLNINSKTLSE